jgi:Zn-dependent protease with chaperone function
MAKLGGFFLLACAIVPFAEIGWGDASRWADGILVGVGVALLAAAWLALRLGFRPDRYSVELSDEGVRVPGRDRSASWSELAELRARPFLKRVDILDRSGRRFASLEYQLESFQEALDQTVESMRIRSPVQDVFRRSYRTPAALLAAGLLAGFGAVWVDESSWHLAAFVALAAAAWSAVAGVRSVSFARDGVVIRRALGSRKIHWYGVQEVRLALDDSQQHLDVLLQGRTEAGTSILPPGANPIHLWARARRLLGSSPAQTRPLEMDAEWQEAPSLSSILHRMNHRALRRPDPHLSRQLDSLLQRIGLRKRVAFYALVSVALAVGLLTLYSGAVVDHPILACVALAFAAAEWIWEQCPLHRRRVRLRNATPEMLGDHSAEQLRRCVGEVHQAFHREWGVRAVPHVFLVETEEDYASVTRSSLLWFVPSLNAVYVDRELIHALEPHELQTVVAHELAHFHRYSGRLPGVLEVARLLAAVLLLWTMIAFRDFVLSLHAGLEAISLAVLSWLLLCVLVFVAYKAFDFFEVLCAAAPILLARGEGFPQEFLCDYTAAQMFGVLPTANALLKLDLLNEGRRVVVEEVSNVLATNTEQDIDEIFEAAEAARPRGFVRPEEVRVELRRRLEPMTGPRSIFEAEFDEDARIEQRRQLVRGLKRAEKDLQRARRVDWLRFDFERSDRRLDSTEWAAFVDALLRHDDARIGHVDHRKSSEFATHPSMRDRILFLATALPVDAPTQRSKDA